MAARWLAALAAAMLVSTVLVVASGSARDTQTVRITMHHSRFLPAQFNVREGTTVRFVITNIDPIDHEFILGDEAVQQRHEDGSEPEHGHIPGEVTVRAGMVAETTYTFSQTGRLLIGCHAPGHYAYGMKGSVTVTPP
ncbi:MAG: cupredoxin domain-containing protein [bacterium]